MTLCPKSPSLAKINCSLVTRTRLACWPRHIAPAACITPCCLPGRKESARRRSPFTFARHIFSHPDAISAPSEIAPPDTASHIYRLVAQGAHPSLLHLTRPFVEKDKKFKTVITVEEIRRVSRFLSLTAPDGGYRIVLVDPADDMNNSAANALLKNLEEPPPRTLFILVAQSLGRILPTIRSRCQIVRFQPLASATLLSLLEKLNADLPDDAEGARGIA